MISENKLAKALGLQLLTMQASLPPIIIQGEDEEYDKSDGFIREALLPAPTVAFGLSETDTQRGIYQVDVLTPKESGKWANYELIDIIKAGFARNTRLVEGGQEVTILTPAVSNLRAEGAYFLSHISIGYIVIV